MAGLPTYDPQAPTLAEMTQVALTIISRDEDDFFAAIEEEGTDNIANSMNAAGTLEALARADEATGVMVDFVEGRTDTLLVMAADSDAGGLQVLTSNAGMVAAYTNGGDTLHGVQGPFGDAFMTAPDANGVSHPFAIGLNRLQRPGGRHPGADGGLQPRPRRAADGLDRGLHADVPHAVRRPDAVT
jgi:alkaline phosphatase